MRKFCTLIKHYDVYKIVNGHKIKNGNRVYHFQQIHDTIPTRILSDNGLIRIVYNKNITRDYCSDAYWDYLLKYNSKDWTLSDDPSSNQDDSSDSESDPIDMDVAPLVEGIKRRSIISTFRI